MHLPLETRPQRDNAGANARICASFSDLLCPSVLWREATFGVKVNCPVLSRLGTRENWGGVKVVLAGLAARRPLSRASSRCSRCGPRQTGRMLARSLQQHDLEQRPDSLKLIGCTVGVAFR
jgi:hypothetical protein